MKEPGHKVVVELPNKKYKRYKYVDDKKRIIRIDFRCISSDPFIRVNYGARRCYIWKSPQQLQQLVNSYFESCFGPCINPQTKKPYLNKDGSLARFQIKPFTVSGLALYCHISSELVRGYSEGKIDSLGYPTDEDYVGPTYSEIMSEARRRIETYAEERLYDKEGSFGGKYVLDSAFGWKTSKENAEIKNMKRQAKLKKQELLLKQQALEQGDDVEEPTTIIIKRVGNED